MQIHNLRYNDRSRAFEASVDITRHGKTFRYPCEVVGPQSLDPAIVTANLCDRALRMSDS
jgi:hypothetical protein